MADEEATTNVEQETPTCGEALAHLRQAVAEGSHWFPALLEAVAMWHLPEETIGERRYCYLVGGEAFDWLLLAERLIESLDGTVPEEEREALLFSGQMPLDLDAEEFKTVIGAAKHTAHLNYLYGVTVEEALQLAVEEELHKERFAQCSTRCLPADEEVMPAHLRQGADGAARALSRGARPAAVGLYHLQRPEGFHLLALQVPPAQLRPRTRRLRHAQGIVAAL